MDKYDRLIKLIGEEGFKKLQNTTVAIIGVGGVGGYATECLGRSGIGKLILVDADSVDTTNLNRQIIATKDTIGKSKTKVMAERISLISDSKSIIMPLFLDESNISKLWEHNPDYIIDACDCVETKKILIKECLKRNIVFISCMGTGKKLDPSKLTICDIRNTNYDPLAKIIRKYVRDEKLIGKVPVVASSEEPQDIKGSIASICYMPAIAGNLCASYIIRKILGIIN